MEFDDISRIVREQFGLRGNFGKIQLDYILRWGREWHLSAPLVCEACRRTVQNTSKSDFRYADKILTDCPWYAALTIPAGTYSGFDQDAKTITVKATLICSADLDEEVAYTIVSTIYEGAADITELHAKGAELSLEFATDGIAVPFHAGAAKYFEEKGVTVKTE